MIAYLTTWIKDIIFVVLFSSFLELLLPNGNMQKFVRVIMGLFILLTILNPVISLIENQTAAKQLPAMASIDIKQTNAAILNTAGNIADKHQQLACDLYVRDLSKQIRATVMSIDGVANAKVVVAIEPATPPSKRIGKIENVLIYVEPGVTNNERKISKINLGITIPETTEEAKTLSTVLVDKIRRTVSEFYQLRSSQIEIMQMN